MCYGLLLSLSLTLSLSHTHTHAHIQSTSTPFPPLRSIPVTRTGQYYYRLKGNDDDNEVSTLILMYVCVNHAVSCLQLTQLFEKF